MSHQTRVLQKHKLHKNCEVENVRRLKKHLLYLFVHSAVPHYTLHCVLQTVPILWGHSTFTLSVTET